ncbi:DNA polymerase III subunit epsilon [Microbulbifer thermotolerans]|uniref:DNA polymerase III subunit epsilon n=1 Tax=Microbulbifer thermotolerans TaxID=252514 RepID=UPI00224B4BB1|nr:DNA polymerase III subunit epsilon [Microbulbifer thermotolerans]MCX2779581.1 DNA polymerase III subunit epsilon [Microbulbifer thermotolerans]MCX2804988.1 DNA polymerase III subunit epsilon [Microbulbifer thermotolerans]
MRQIVLDTETTGLDPKAGHRIIEIGCVELVNRKLTGRHYHQYINPEREVDDGAIEVHGITNEFLADKPVFAQIADEFMTFCDGAELVIHNAPFDVGFIDWELKLLGSPRWQSVAAHCTVLDTLALAREKHPGQKNNLDALCKRYFVDNSQRDLHGALLDAEILADVYLMMTGGQTDLALAQGGDQQSGEEESGEQRDAAPGAIRRLAADRKPLRVVKASAEEVEAHQAMLAMLEKNAGKHFW